MPKNLLAEIVLFAFGLALVLDAVFFRLITFDYAGVGLASLDPIFSHAYIGAFLMSAALIDYWFRSG